MKSLDRKVNVIARSKTPYVGLRKEHILTGTKDQCGYIHVRLSKDGKITLFKVHHLVAAAFLGYDKKQYDRKDSDSLVVDHIDGDKTNNDLSNLEIVTTKENTRRYYERRHKEAPNGNSKKA